MSHQRIPGDWKPLTAQQFMIAAGWTVVILLAMTSAAIVMKHVPLGAICSLIGVVVSVFILALGAVNQMYGEVK